MKKLIKRNVGKIASQLLDNYKDDAKYGKKINSLILKFSKADPKLARKLCTEQLVH